MKLTICSGKAKEYACKTFHYSKSVPVNTFGYNVYNDSGEWCGVILFAPGACKELNLTFGLQKGEVMELVRVALNGKQEGTGKAMALAVKLIKKDCPLVKILVSYADEAQGHKGIIYQATNWIYIAESKQQHYELDGKFVHNRIYYGYSEQKKAKCIKKPLFPKHKFVYPLYKEYVPLCESLRKDKLFMR